MTTYDTEIFKFFIFRAYKLFNFIKLYIKLYTICKYLVIYRHNNKGARAQLLKHFISQTTKYLTRSEHISNSMCIVLTQLK